MEFSGQVLRSRPIRAGRVSLDTRRHALAPGAVQGHAGKSPIAPLSSREVHVLEAVAEGLSNKQIGHRLGISEKTVRNHMSKIFEKLQANNRTQAVILAMGLGLRIL